MAEKRASEKQSGSWGWERVPCEAGHEGRSLGWEREFSTGEDKEEKQHRRPRSRWGTLAMSPIPLPYDSSTPSKPHS